MSSSQSDGDRELFIASPSKSPCSPASSSRGGSTEQGKCTLTAEMEGAFGSSASPRTADRVMDDNMWRQREEKAKKKAHEQELARQALLSPRARKGLLGQQGSGVIL